MSTVDHASREELDRLLAELQRERDERARLAGELEDTNRGVLALYAELDERAEALRRADEVKTRFFSSMSHELRTPLTSILALTRLLEKRTDGELSPEQARQVGYIRQAAESLTELVNDLLDLARVQAGKSPLRFSVFEVADLFRALRGMLKPVAVSDAVALVIDEPAHIRMHTDEGKLAQVLRNFISNALKFTEQGEVQVTAECSADGAHVTFSVADTGIGIAPEDQPRIFEEFGQVENRLQRKVRGTGLGLALCLRLAEVLGGRIALSSAPGQGSTFSLALPAVHPALSAAERKAVAVFPNATLLVVDDEEISRYVIRATLAGLVGTLLEASNGADALRLVRERRPDALFTDLVMPGMGGMELLAQLRADTDTRSLPAVLTTSMALDPEQRERLTSWGVPLMSKRSWSDAGAREVAADALRQAGLRPEEG